MTDRPANVPPFPGGAIELDGSVLRTATEDVDLSPTESVVMAVLMARNGSLATRAELEAALASQVAITPRVADDVVYRLRRRIRPHGLDVAASRGRGFMLRRHLDEPGPLGR
ncbi:MAG: winged helix-turn-helix domain-containing protein [Acidimicrobiia bacterium]